MYTTTHQNQEWREKAPTSSPPPLADSVWEEAADFVTNHGLNVSQESFDTCPDGKCNMLIVFHVTKVVDVWVKRAIRAAKGKQPVQLSWCPACHTSNPRSSFKCSKCIYIIFDFYATD